MRELTLRECDFVAGGPGPLAIAVVPAIIGAVGGIIGAVIGSSSSGNTGTAPNGATVNCPSGTAPKVTATTAECVKIDP